MNNRLFVYGSLMGDGFNGKLLRPFAAIIRPARINGTLYHTGYGFPVVDVEVNGLVLGELVTLNDPAAAFAVLDRYEGISDASFTLYRRIEINAWLCEAVDPIPVLTHIYAVNPAKLASIPGLERVESGNWLRFLMQQRSHR